MAHEENVQTVETTTNEVAAKPGFFKKHWGKGIIGSFVALIGFGFIAEAIVYDKAVPQENVEKTVRYINFLRANECTPDVEPTVAKICADEKLLSTIIKHNTREMSQFGQVQHTIPEIAEYINNERTARVEKITKCISRKGPHLKCISFAYEDVQTESGVNQMIEEVKERQRNSPEARFERMLQEMASSGGQCGWAANFVRQVANTYGIASQQAAIALGQAAERGC